jgi:uncharacterized membrane protein
MASAGQVVAPASLLQRLLPNWLLAALSLVMALAALVAIVRGFGRWGALPPVGWLHLMTILVATFLTPVMLLRPKGTRPHRRLGYVWAGAMVLTAVTSLFFKVRGDSVSSMGVSSMGVFSGDFSPIHILSVFVLVMVPVAVLRARRHDRAGHESAIRGLVIGALLVAGFFTFPYGRLLGTWLFG